jgi:hypothetical protein
MEEEAAEATEFTTEKRSKRRRNGEDELFL